IYRCSALVSFIIENGIGLNVMRYISNVNAYFVIAIFENTKAQCIVKIFSVCRIYCKSQYIAHVSAFCYFFFFFDRCIELISKLRYFFWELIRQAVLRKYGVYFGVVLARFTKYFYNFSERRIRFFGPIVYAY